MRRILPTPMLALLLAACAGEPVRTPAIPEARGYTPSPVALERGDAAQRVVMGRDIPARWWTLFRSPSLDKLVREALDASPTVERAAAKLRGASETLEGRAGATTLPRVDARLSGNRVDVNAESLGGRPLPIDMPLNLYLASVNVSYTLDLFGATRGELDALRAAADSDRHALEGARQTLAANVVTAVIRAASLQEQLAQSREALALQARQLAIAEELERAGGLSRADVAARREELARAGAALPDLLRELQQVRHRLAVYTGRPPDAADIPHIPLSELALPAELPVSLPSSLVRQRPDILAAEALLREAGARVGVANANLYPQITLTATAGSLATSGSGLLSSGTSFYLLGAALAQPIFHGGELQSKRRAAVAAYDQAAAAYRETVLHAFGNVADVLRALEADAAKVEERASAEREARGQAAIASARHAAGGVSELAVLDAKRRVLVAANERTRAVADRHADSAALLQAVGGGWWNEADAAKAGE